MPERGRMRSNAEARGSRREMSVGFQSRKDKTACSCRLSPRSPRPRDVISTKKSVQNYKTGFLRRSTAVSSQGARAGKRGRVRLAGTASPHLCPADTRNDLKTGFCLRSPPRRPMTSTAVCGALGSRGSALASFSRRVRSAGIARLRTRIFLHGGCGAPRCPGARPRRLVSRGAVAPLRARREPCHIL